MTKKISPNGKTCITFVLDETGSMMVAKDQTISGFNEFMDSQEDKALGECRVTLIKFNSDKIDTVYADKLVEDVPKLTSKNYCPDATTPLYDAIAQAIKDTEAKFSVSSKVLNKLAGHQVPIGPLVIIVIMTDGQENASRQYNQRQVFDMIEEKRKLGWTFVYLGANQDSWAAARPLGIDVGNIANYTPGQTKRAFVGVAQSMSSYRASYRDLASATASYQALAKQDIDSEEAKEAFAKLEAATAKLTALRKNYYQGKTEL